MIVNQVEFNKKHQSVFSESRCVCVQNAYQTCWTVYLYETEDDVITAEEKWLMKCFTQYI